MLDDYRTLVRDMIRDSAARVADDQLDRAIVLAVAQYDKDRPRRVVEDVISPGGRVLDYPAGATTVADIEYPAGEMPPRYLPSLAWSIYQAPDGLKLVFRDDILIGTTLRLGVHRPHILTAVDDTIAEADREAVGSYAAAILFDQMSAATSADGNPTIEADAINHQAKPDNFASRARNLRQRYYDLLGIDPKRVQAASINVPMTLPSSTGGRRLTHHRRRLRL